MKNPPKTVKVGVPVVEFMLRKLWFALLIHWLFQGLLYMDKTEKLFKILIDVTIISMWLMVFGATIFNFLIGSLVAHTINFIFNSQLNVVLKNFGITRVDEERLRSFLSNATVRIRSNNSIEVAAVYGSFTRGQLKQSSDLDIRLVRRKGIVNAIFSCWFVLVERTRALLVGVPLDIYVLDTRIKLRDLKEYDNEVWIKS